MLRVTEDVLKTWKKLRENGFTYDEIAAQYGVHRTTIKRKLEKNSTMVRKGGEFYKGKYKIAFYNKNTMELGFCVNNRVEFFGLFPNYKSFDRRILCIYSKKDSMGNQTMTLNDITYIVKFIDKDDDVAQKLN